MCTFVTKVELQVHSKCHKIWKMWETIYFVLWWLSSHEWVIHLSLKKQCPMVKHAFEALTCHFDRLQFFTRLKTNNFNRLFKCSHQREACKTSPVAAALLCSYLNSRIIFQRLLMYNWSADQSNLKAFLTQKAGCRSSLSASWTLTATARFRLTPRRPWLFSGMYEGWIMGQKKDNILQCWKFIAGQQA